MCSQVSAIPTKIPLKSAVCTVITVLSLKCHVLSLWINAKLTRLELIKLLWWVCKFSVFCVQLFHSLMFSMCSLLLSLKSTSVLSSSKQKMAFSSILWGQKTQSKDILGFSNKIGGEKTPSEYKARKFLLLFFVLSGPVYPHPSAARVPGAEIDL